MTAKNPTNEQAFMLRTCRVAGTLRQRVNDLGHPVRIVLSGDGVSLVIPRAAGLALTRADLDPIQQLPVALLSTD